MDSDFLVLRLVICVICGVAAAAIASSKGRSVVGWFFGGFFLTLLGIIIVACLSNRKEEANRRAYMEREQHRLREQLRQERMKHESFRQYTMGRIDEHDRVLGVDTRQTHPALTSQQQQQAFLPGGQQTSLPPVEGQASPSSLAQTNDPLRSLQAAAGGGPLSPATPAKAAAEGFTNPYQAAQAARATWWYYERMGQSVGPVSEAVIRSLLASGQVSRTTLLWSEALPDWTMASQVPAFRDFAP